MKRSLAVIGCLSLLLSACSSAAPITDAASRDQVMDAAGIERGSLLRMSYEEWIAYHNAQPGQDTLCEAKPLPNKPGNMILMVDDSHKAITLLCAIGAYQNAYVVYEVDTDTAGNETVKQLEFEVFTPELERSTVKVLMDTKYNPSSRTILSKAKGSELGDCGWQGAYAWNNLKGEFELDTFYMKGECDGDASDWPLIYQRSAL